MGRPLSEEQIQEFRDELCDCATRLFAERGLSGVTLRSIASEMGCSPMTPYRYFQNKEEIFEAVCAAAFRRLGDRSIEAARAHRDPIERFIALGRVYVRFAQDEPHAYRIMFQLERPRIPLDGESHPEIEEELKRGWSCVVEAARDAVEAGRLEGDPLTLAHLAWVQLHGLVTLHLSDRLQMERKLEDLLEPLLHRFIRGSSARPVEGVPPA